MDHAVRIAGWALRIIGAMVAPLVFVSPVWGQVGAYYSIVSIKSQQLSNAVRITISADGAISQGLDIRDYIDMAALARQGRFSPEMYKPVDKILLHLHNARSQVGSFVYVGKYPVSHVELSVPPSAERRFRLDVRICLYTMAKLRYNAGYWGESSAAGQQRDFPWFEAVTSPNRRSLIITVMSDRLPEMRQRRMPEDISDTDRELKVGFADGRLDIHAKNARLSELIQSVSRATGKQMLVDTATERTVTAELPYITPDDFAARISESYSLVLNGTPECRVLSDISAGTPVAYTTGTTTEIPVRCLEAGTARSLLPSFLLDYLRVDSERNVLVVSGSTALTEKIRSDLAKIDRPGTTVTIQARLIESSSTEELTRELTLDYSSGRFRATADISAGRLTYSTVGVLASDFEAKLGALVAAQKAKVTANSTVKVLSGQTAQLFAGLDKYIQYLSTSSGGVRQVLEPVSAGVKTSATAWSGGETVMLSVVCEVRNIGEIDPMTHLPVINTRRAQGTFRIRPGETVLIGGLSQSETYQAVRMIPVLGRLPIVGGLFRRKVKQQTQTELTVLLTPTVSGSQQYAMRNER